MDIQRPARARKPGTPESRLWVGCYTPELGGSGTGITMVSLSAHGALSRVASSPLASPSFLAMHPAKPVVYAVAEGDRAVRSYSVVDGSALVPLGSPGVTGEYPCHVAVDPAGRFLVVSCWGDGSVVLFELDDHGALGRGHQARPSSDPYAQGRRSRAHAFLMLDDGRAVSTDIGHDLLRLWTYVPDLGLVPSGDIALPHGFGPRHVVKSPSARIYVVGEYAIDVAVLGFNPASANSWLELLAVVPATAAGPVPGDQAAEICFGIDETRLYVGVRGSDRISTLRIDQDGVPHPERDADCGGRWPRHHRVIDGGLVVALQKSDALAAFTLDPSTGELLGPPRMIATGSPSYVLPATVTTQP